MLTTRIGRTRATLLLLVATLGILAGASPAAALAHPVAAQVDCDIAQRLTDKGEPADALELVRAIRASAVEAATDADKAAAASECAEEFRAAIAAICLEADELNDQARFEDAVALIDGVRDPAIAAVGGGTAAPSERKAATGCDREYRTATEALESTTLSDDVGAAWGRVVADWVVPLQAPALWVLGILVGVLVLARVIVFFGPPYPVVTPRTMRRWGLAIWALPVGAVAVVLALSPVPGAAAPAIWLLIAGILVLALGFAGTLLYFGGRLRVVLEYGSEDDRAPAADVIAKLTRLGGGPMQGVEVPTAPDITALEGQPLTAVVGGSAFTAFLSALAAVFTAIPWTVRVTDIPGGEGKPPVAHVVSISRNGRTVVTRTIDTAKLRTASVGGSGPLAPRWFIASVILIALAEHYAGFAGITRRTDWRSLGLGVVAGQEFPVGSEQSASLAALALRLDGSNDFAEQIYMYARYRHTPGVAGTARYVQWLRGKLNDPTWLEGQPESAISASRVRLQTNYIAVVRNLVAESGGFPVGKSVATLTADEAVLRELALDAARRNDELLESVDSAAPAGSVLAEIRYRAADAAAIFRHWFPRVRRAWSPDEVARVIAESEASRQPGVAYSTICRWAVLGELDATKPPATGDGSDPLAVFRAGGTAGSKLTVTAAALEEKLRLILDTRHVVIDYEKGEDWLQQDPELRSARSNPTFTRVIDEYTDREKKRDEKAAADADDGVSPKPRPKQKPKPKVEGEGEGLGI